MQAVDKVTAETVVVGTHVRPGMEIAERVMGGLRSTAVSEETCGGD
jgi:hypothetical protein